MKRRMAGAAATLVCLVLGGLRWLDLVNFTELSTGFVTAGTPGLRYLLAAAGAAALFVLSRLAGLRSAGGDRPAPVLGALSLLAGLAFAAAGGWQMYGWYAIAGGGTALADGLLAVLCGVFFAVRGAAAFRAPAGEKACPAWFAIAGNLLFLWLSVCRFVIAPTSVARVGSVMLVLAAIAALLFGAAYCKLVCLPGAPCGKSVFFSGMLCFLLCTCGEFAQALCAVLAGGALLEDPFALPFGLLGLCGLAAAWRVTDPERE